MSEYRRGEDWRPTYEALIIVGVLVLLFALAIWIHNNSGDRTPTRISACKNYLKQIGLALHNYAEVYHAFPPAYTVDAQGKRLHSWRTLILPFMEQQGLYDSIDLSKPWDDPANAKIGIMPVHGYRCPGFDGPKNYSTYLAVVAPGSLFLPTGSHSLADVTDDPGNTLMVFEVDSDHAVPWMKPEDADEALLVSLNSKSKLPHGKFFYVLFVDGSCRTLDVNLPAEKRRAMISIAGGD